MRRRDWPFLIVAAAALLGGGCSVGSDHARKSTASGSVIKASRQQSHDTQMARERKAIRDKLTLATNRLQAGNHDKAEQLAREVLKKDADSVDAYSILAVSAEQRGRNSLAGEHYRKAAMLLPQQALALNNYGAWLCDNGHAAESLVWFDRALADPANRESSSLLANAGGCALRAGQVERGLPNLRQALVLDPLNAFALAAMAEHEYQGGRYLQARAFSERRLSAAPANASVLKLANQIEMALGDKVAASQYQQRLITEFPATATANPGDEAL